MNAAQVVELSRRTIEAAFWVAAPILLSAMIVGLIINIGQVMTSIQDMTVSTVPRLTAVGVIIFFLTPWMLLQLVTFTQSLFSDFRVYTPLKDSLRVPIDLQRNLDPRAHHRFARRRHDVLRAVPWQRLHSRAHPCRFHHRSHRTPLSHRRRPAFVSYSRGKDAPGAQQKIRFSGLALGLTIQFVFEGAQMAGQVGGFQFAFSLVNVIDPQTQVETPVLSVFHQLVVLLLFLQFECASLDSARPGQEFRIRAARQRIHHRDVHEGSLSQRRCYVGYRSPATGHTHLAGHRIDRRHRRFS